jgi:hypothetical protein
MLSMQQKKNNTVPSQDLEDIISPYDYANRRDAENFCPIAGRPDGEVADSSMDDHHDGDAGGMTFDDHTADFGSQNDTANTQSLGQFSGSNLVAAPNMVRESDETNPFFLHANSSSNLLTGGQDSDQLRSSGQENGHEAIEINHVEHAQSGTTLFHQ